MTINEVIDRITSPKYEVVVFKNGEFTHRYTVDYTRERCSAGSMYSTLTMRYDMPVEVLFAEVTHISISPWGNIELGVEINN